MGIKSHRASGLKGEVTIPGDKSISHRALLMGGLSGGETTVTGLLEGEDVLRTAAAVRAFGATVSRDISSGAPVWAVQGCRWESPERPVYFGNSGTGVRLAMGAAAGQGIDLVFEGDASLRARPMRRVTAPLAAMGATFPDGDETLPIKMTSASLGAISFRSPVASAQVKSAILLAALGADGVTEFIEPVGTRDHTERMFSAFGVELAIEELGNGGRAIKLAGGQSLKGCAIDVPGDPSSAAFLAAAASICPDADVLIKNVLINPFRNGVFDTLQEMGADLTYKNKRRAQGEEIADLHVRSAKLKGIRVPAARAAAMIDEYPILSIVASFAEGETYMEGVGELRVKESDRIASVEAGLKANGVNVESGDDWMKVQGNPNGVAGGGTVVTNADHRIAMSFLIMGLASDAPVAIDDASMIKTSFPGFTDLLGELGGKVSDLDSY